MQNFRPIAAFSRFGAPAIWLLGRSTDLILRLFGRHGPPAHTVTEEELKMLITEGAATGVIEHQERDIINRVLRLADKPVRAIMTPRNDLAWIDRTDPKADIVATLRAAPHSRFVVCDGSVDNVVGVVEAKDLLDRMLGGEDLAIAAVLKQPMVMPDTVTALEALEQLRSDALGIALVMDESVTQIHEHYRLVALAQRSETGERPQAQVVFAEGDTEHRRTSWQCRRDASADLDRCRPRQQGLHHRQWVGGTQRPADHVQHAVRHEIDGRRRFVDGVDGSGDGHGGRQRRG